MNLHDYFRSQKNFSLEPSRKMAIYDTITQRTHAPVSVFARMSFYTKLSLYTFIGLVFLASLYIPYFSSFIHETDGVLTVNQGGASVQADYIAQIIETKGDIAIYNNGEKVESKLFRAGDRLVLPAGAEILFHVTTIAQAKVVGPAEFSIEKTEQGYIIQLISGKYAEIQSLNEDKEPNNESVGLRSSRVSITPKQAAHNIHFTYTEKGKDAMIDNQGDSELVVAKVEDADKQEILAIHSMAQVGDTGAILDEITGVNILTGKRMTPVELASALTNAQQEEAGKKMVSGADHETIKAILSAEFLGKDIQNITESYLKGSSRDYEISYLNLYNKIEQIYMILGIKIPEEYSTARSTVSIKSMIGTIENLLDQMQDHYYVAQSHQSRLKKILGWLYALREEAFGSQRESNASGSAMLGTLNLDDYKDLLGK